MNLARPAARFPRAPFCTSKSESGLESFLSSSLSSSSDGGGEFRRAEAFEVRAFGFGFGNAERAFEVEATGSTSPSLSLASWSSSSSSVVASLSPLAPSSFWAPCFSCSRRRFLSSLAFLCWRRMRSMRQLMSWVLAGILR